MKSTNIILLVFIIFGLAWAGYELRRIADNSDKHEAIDFESYWEVAFVNTSAMDLLIRTARDDSTKAVMIERKDEYLKMMGRFKLEQKWECKQDQKLREKYEKWFKEKD